MPRYQRLGWKRLNVDGDDEICTRADAFARARSAVYLLSCLGNRLCMVGTLTAIASRPNKLAASCTLHFLHNLYRSLTRCFYRDRSASSTICQHSPVRRACSLSVHSVVPLMAWELASCNSFVQRARRRCRQDSLSIPALVIRVVG